MEYVSWIACDEGPNSRSGSCARFPLMLISRQRHERDKAEAIARSARVHEEILGGLPQGLFVLDHDLRIRAPVTRATEALFQRRNLVNTAFDQLLEGILPPHLHPAADGFLTRMCAVDAPADLNGSNPLQQVEARISGPDGAVSSRFLCFAFRRIVTLADARCWIVTVTDISQKVETEHELEELRAYSRAQSACLAGIVRVGADRFFGFLRRSDIAVNTITAVLKKPARTSDAFRMKLDEILQATALIRQQSQALELETIERLAQVFEDAVAELKLHPNLSGSDFLPLAARLDDLFAQLALMRSMTSLVPAHGPASALGPAETATDAQRPPCTDNGTEIIAPDRLEAIIASSTGAAAGLPPTVTVSRTPPAGSLERALQSLAEHMAQSHGCSVELGCQGLADVPGAYQGVIKNIAIQLIRNSIMHGIEPEEQRIAAGKPAIGRLRLRFHLLADQGCQLSFEDDGRGLDSDQLRATAVARGLMTAEAAAQLTSRQAIKLIFRNGFSTVPNPTVDVGRGIGMALVRRHVAQLGGRVALASKPGLQTRFRIMLPPVSDAPARARAR